MSPLSGVLNEAWALYRRHAPHFLLISFTVYLVIAVLNALLTWGLGGVGVIIGWVISLFGMFLLQAALVIAVRDVRDGRADLDLGATLSAAAPFVGTVAIASILAAIGIAIGFALIIVPGLILVTFWCLLVPEIVIGGAGALDSFGRSWRTVRGYAWNVFGTFVVVFLIYLIGEWVLQLILFHLPIGWRSFIADLVAGALLTPFLAAVITLIYYRLTSAHGEQPESGPGNSSAGSYGPYDAGYGQPGGPGGYGQPGSGGYDQPGPSDYGQSGPGGYSQPGSGDYGQPGGGNA
jgi:hypothetical protein